MLNIYRGGVDDGYDDLAFAEPDNPILAIYKGGNDDGYDFDSFEECLGSLVKWRGTLSIDSVSYTHLDVYKRQMLPK